MGNKNFTGQGFTRNFIKLMKELEQQRECCTKFLTGIFTEDTESIHFTGDGTEANPLEANVKISSTAGNIATINSTGLYVPPPSGGVMADNGLSISGGFVQLGQAVGALGDPGALIKNTEIPFGGGFQLSYIDRASGNNTLYDPQTVAIVTNADDWSTFSPQISENNNNSFFGISGSNNVGLGGDILLINFSNGGNNGRLGFLTSGNILVFNQLFTPTFDSHDLLQIVGSVYIDVSHAAPATGNAFSINPFVDVSGNSQGTQVTQTGYWSLFSSYNATNGGLFQGNVNLNQIINFTSGSEEQVGISQSTAINWENAHLGTANLIAISQDIRTQFNLDSATSLTPGQIVVDTGGAEYGANIFAYRGMNPSSDTTGKLVVINGGTQTGATRPLPLSIFAARTDIDNGGTIILMGNYSNYASDIAIGAFGTLERFIDYSAGGAVNFAATSFTIDTRIAFWAQDLSSSMNVTNAYAFYSEGAADKSYLAGKLIIGGANPPTFDTNQLKIFGTTDGFLSLTGDTLGRVVISGTDESTYDTTGGALISYGGKFISAASKSAGASQLISIGLYGANAGSADVNFAAVFELGCVQIAHGGATLANNGATLQVQGNQSWGVVQDSSASLSLDDSGVIYVFNGTTATWSLPAIGSNVGWFYFIKNRGSGNLTINVTGGGAHIYTTSAVSSFVVAAGASAKLFNDGGFWCSE